MRRSVSWWDRLVARVIRWLHWHSNCRACGMQWCGHIECDRWHSVKSNYEWDKARGAYRRLR